MTEPQHDPIVGKIIGAAIRVHSALGPGLLESAYQACLAFEVAQTGLHVAREVGIPLQYGEVRLDCGYRLDLVVDHDVIVEVKSVEKLLPIHSAQVMTYLRLTGARRGLLFNFNAPTIRAGLRSFIGPGKQVPPDKRKTWPSETLPTP